MTPFQMIQAFRNPQQFIQSMMNDSQVMQNPTLKSALTLAKKRDDKGMEQLARNVCSEKGVNPDEAVGQIKNFLGIK